MTWIFLSPHLDDAVLSCGGLIYTLAQSGEHVQVWTVCAGDPPAGELSPLARELHKRWQAGVDAPARRRAEDRAACRLLDAKPVHFDIPECIYRRHPLTGEALIGSNEELFQPLPEFEKPLVARVSQLLAENLHPSDNLVSPLAIGSHVDHHLVRGAAETLEHPLWYYPDFPYHANKENNQNGCFHTDWQPFYHPVSEHALAIWQQAVMAYRSQISTFWGNMDEMKSSLRTYWKQGGGSLLWSNHPTDM